MEQNTLTKLKLEIQLNAKKGIDFILSAGIIWSVISIIWSLNYTSYSKSIFTFIVGALLLPLAIGFSKFLKTNWKIKNNPLQPLGLWLNFAQLLYFPFLVFILIDNPDYFIMTYAIITGAHLFPYAWFYNEKGYAITAVSISVGSLLIALNIEVEIMWIVPLFTAIILFLFAWWIFMSIKNYKAI